MSSKKYTVTVYAAAPGTPLFNDKTGLPERDEKTGKQKTSLPGHMFYAVSADGGRTQTAYGFAPREGAERAVWYSPDMPGEIQDAEHKIYRNPYYARTMEITEQQYSALQNFGKKPEKYGFNRNTYNLATNSCIDFTFKALKESGIYQGRPIEYHKEGVKIGSATVYEKAALRVLENIPVPEKIPDQMNSPLNRTVRGKMPNRTIWQWLLTENQQQQLNPEQPQHAQSRSLTVDDMPKQVQDMYGQCRTLLVEFDREEGVTRSSSDYDAVSRSMAVQAYAAGLPEVQFIHVEKNGQINIGYESPSGMFKEATTRTDQALATSLEDSIAQARQAEHDLALATEQRARDIAEYQAQSYGGRSIG